MELTTFKKYYFTVPRVFTLRLTTGVIIRGHPFIDLIFYSARELLRAPCSSQCTPLFINNLLSIFLQVIEKFGRHKIKRFKEPCFHDGDNDTLVCLPYFYLVSPPKSATTDLWLHIHRHPHLFLSKPNAKEPHWWGVQKKTG